jgi:hypothetical protein
MEIVTLSFQSNRQYNPALRGPRAVCINKALRSANAGSYGLDLTFIFQVCAHITLIYAVISSLSAQRLPVH